MAQEPSRQIQDSKILVLLRRFNVPDAGLRTVGASRKSNQEQTDPLSHNQSCRNLEKQVTDAFLTLE